jgi:phytanoyl-CoA hydroxylase
MHIETAQYEFDQEIEECATDLYRFRSVADGVVGFDAITDAQIAQFHTQGYLVVYDALPPGEVQDTLDGLLDLIDGKNPGYRGVQFEGKARAMLDTLPAEKRQDAVRKLWRFVEYDARLKALAEQPKLLEVITRMMGEQPELFQDQALFKPPLIGREKPWHQDNAYFNLPPETLVIGVWIALDEATPENGCMHIIPGSHRQGPIVHFKRRDWQICDTDVTVDHVIAAPLKPGGCLLFNGLLHHGTPPSRSPERRRAVQLHYKPASVAPIAPAERMAVFGSEGKDVTC